MLYECTLSQFSIQSYVIYSSSTDKTIEAQEGQVTRSHFIKPRLLSISLSYKHTHIKPISWGWPVSGHAAVRPGLWGCLLNSACVSSTDQVACAHPEICQKVCSNPSGCSDIAYPKLVLELLPTGNALLTPPTAPENSQKGSHWLGSDLRVEQTPASEPKPQVQISLKVKIVTIQGLTSIMLFEALPPQV